MSEKRSEYQSGGAAFPRNGHGVVVDDIDSGQEGMTLLDWFAGQIAAALVVGDDEFEFAEIAKVSYGVAESLMTERRRRFGKPGEGIQ